MKDNFIEIFKKREFSELISTPITFLIQEFKQLAITLLVFVGPVILVNAIIMKSLGMGFSQDILSLLRGGGSIQNYQGSGSIVLIYIFHIFQSTVLYTVTAVYLKLYRQRGNGSFHLQDVWGEFRLRIGQTTLAMFVAFILMLVGFFAFFIPGLYLAVVFYIFCAVIVFEELTFGEAFTRIFKIIKGNWWITLGSFLVLGIIAGIINMVISALLGIIFGFAGFILSTTIVGSVSLIVSSVLGILPVLLYLSFIADKENPNLMDRINQIKEEDDVNIFELKEKESINKADEDIIIKKEEAPKTEDEWKELLDNQDKNRFEGEDENDRFKPKF